MSKLLTKDSDIIDDFLKRIVLKENDKGSETYD